MNKSRLWCAVIAVVLSGGLSRAEGIVLVFPSDREVGIVESREIRPYEVRTTYEQWGLIGPAKGKVAIPSGHEVRLRVNAKSIDNLSFLSALPPGSLRYLDLSRTEFKDDQLVHLGSQTRLLWLNLDNARIKGDTIHFKTLSNLSELKQLSLSAFGIDDDGFGVGDEAMKVIGGLPKLERVSLRLTRVTSDGLRELCRCKTLQSIGIEGTPVTDAGLEHLLALPQLTGLSLGVYEDSAKVTDDGMKTIAKLTKLKRLSVSGIPITDEGLGHLAPLTKLEHLNIDNTDISEDGLAALEPLGSLKSLRYYKPITDASAPHLAKVTSLERISSNLDVTDKGVKEIAKLTNLQRLSVSDHVTDVGATEIAKMTGLVELWFQDCPITDAGFEKLSALKNLKHALISGTNLTSEGLRHLAAFPKLESLNLDLLPSESENGEPKKTSLKHLAKLTNIERLDIGGHDRDYHISADQLIHVSGLTKLTRLELEPSIVVDDASVGHLARLKNLEGLDIQGSTLTNKGLVQLGEYDKLEYVTIVGQFDDEGLMQFSKYPKLRFLQVASPFITDAGIERLKQASASLQEINHFEYRLRGDSVAISKNDKFLRRGYRNDDGSDDRILLDAIENRPCPDLQGAEWTNAKTKDMTWDKLEGKVVLVNFFRVRLSSNRRTFAKLKSLQDEYADRGLVVVSLHREEGKAGLKPFVADQKVNWPIAVDREDATAKAMVAHKAFRGCYVIDKKGVLRMASLHPAELERAIELLLGE